MDKPQAKTELMVRAVTSTRDYRTISLTYASAEAEAWITSIAPRYGVLIACKGQRYTLSVDTGIWDVHEVAAYIGSYVLDEECDGLKLLRKYVEELEDAE